MGHSRSIRYQTTLFSMTTCRCVVYFPSFTFCKYVACMMTVVGAGCFCLADKILIGLCTVHVCDSQTKQRRYVRAHKHNFVCLYYSRKFNMVCGVRQMFMYLTQINNTFAHVVHVLHVCGSCFWLRTKKEKDGQTIARATLLRNHDGNRRKKRSPILFFFFRFFP